MDATLEHLPPSIQELVEITDLPAALAIVEVRGGIRLCVPRRAREDHWLAELIGLENMEKLIAIYAGEEIDIPRCLAALKAAKDLQIARDIEQGVSGARLARKYEYTERGMRKVKRRLEERGELKERQGDLF
ncbi:Mor transcription activator family protein [Sulfuriflexus mobilis]|uniref:Mor transcription activator family protein n=1 Tax=Sulfuriflexus mobilis TaxID=1811807 RepID=UPI000F81EB56|nr:Mor transcription activator family protein [Sulfuriflexus mobilis]